MKRTIFTLCMAFQIVLGFADDKEVDKKEWSLVPLLNYEFVSVEGQKYNLPGGGLILFKGDQSPPLAEEPNNLMIGLLYNGAILNNPPFGYTNWMHDIDFIVERRINRSLFQVIVSSNSDKPVYGGLQTTYSSIGYGYQLLRKEKINLTLGAALGIGDFGLNLPNGGIFPILPSPIIRFDFSSQYIHLGFDWPEFKMVLLPESKFRITSTVRLDIYKFKDAHDMLFDCIFWYRFFTKDFVAGDFAGVGLGIKNGGIDFILGEKDKVYDINYYSVFGVLDASFLRINGGYIFYSRELYEKNNTQPTGKGFFVSVSAVYKFDW